MNNKIDVEAELARILQEEIWKEITAETGMTRQDMDNKIIAELIKFRDSQEVPFDGPDQGSIGVDRIQALDEISRKS